MRATQKALHTGLEPAVFRLGGECLTIWPMEPSFPDLLRQSSQLLIDQIERNIKNLYEFHSVLPSAVLG